MLRGEIIDSLHWKEYTFIGQDGLVFEGALTQESEEQITDIVLSIKPIKELLELLTEPCPKCDGTGAETTKMKNYNPIKVIRTNRPCPTCKGESTVPVDPKRIAILTPSLKQELENTKPEFQDAIAYLLNYASGMGAYGDPCGKLAVISPESKKVLITEKL